MLLLSFVAVFSVGIFSAGEAYRSCTWPMFPDHHILGGELKESARTVEDCQSVCEQTADCVSLDYVRSDNKCFLLKTQKDKAFEQGVDHYDHVCVDIASPDVNLALGRPTTQSSTWKSEDDGTLDASKAVDGNYDNYKAPLSCSATNDGSGGPNWWRVQLDRQYHVQKVIVTNRKNCCADRLNNFIVGVTNSTEDPVRGTYPLCGQYPGRAGRGATLTVHCDPNIGAGQYVIIQQPIKGTGWLTLCEVEVYGIADIATPDVNLAHGRPATQSSTWKSAEDGSLDASKAVDGNYDNYKAPLSCSATNDGSGGPNWWRVQLDRQYHVQKVIVTNRKNCCADRLDYFIVGVTNSTKDPVIGSYPMCGQYPSRAGLGATMAVYCDPNIGAGQYVIIQQPIKGTGYLTLCEVEVYARTVRK